MRITMLKYWKKFNHFFAGFVNRKYPFVCYGNSLDSMASMYGVERKLFELDGKFRKRLLKIAWGLE